MEPLKWLSRAISYLNSTMDIEEEKKCNQRNDRILAKISRYFSLSLKPTRIENYLFTRSWWIILHYQLQDYSDYLPRAWRQRQKRQGAHTIKFWRNMKRQLSQPAQKNISRPNIIILKKSLFYFICISINFTQIFRLGALLSKDIQTSRWWRITIGSEESEIRWFLKLEDNVAGEGERDASDVKS